MDFTREPIIESVVTPREGCKLVLRNSKNPGQEEYFVDALEVVAFGSTLFYRSTERPKAFLVPVSDYEVLEVRETRLVLKNVGLDKAIKIGGGREAPRPSKEDTEKPKAVAPVPEVPAPSEPRIERKRERRRHYRRRRGRDKVEEGEGEEEVTSSVQEEELTNTLGFSTPTFSNLLPPPPKLISETIERYKSNALYQGAFFETQSPEEPKPEEPTDHVETPQVVDSTPDEIAPTGVSTLGSEGPHEAEEAAKEISANGQQST